MTLIDRILGKAKATTAEQIRTEESKAERALERARADLETARSKYNSTLLAVDPADTRSAKAAMSDAEDTVARAEALCGALRDRFLQQCEREAEEGRKVAYAEAEKAASEARKAIQRYPELAREVVGVLKTLAQAEHAIQAANSDLPAGTERIVGIEQQVRGLPGEPRRLISEKMHGPVWCYADWPDTMVEKYHYDSIVSDDGITGYFEQRSGFGGARKVPVRKRRRKVLTSQPDIGSYQPVPLAAALSLPGLLPGQPAIWEPTGANMTQHINPGEILAAVEYLETTGWKKPASDPRNHAFPDERVEFVDVDADEEAAVAEAIASSAVM